MNFMNKWPRRLLAALVVFLLLAGLVQLNNVTKPELVNTDGRVFTKAVVTDILRDNIQENGSRIGDQIVALQLADGEQVTANCPFGTVCEPGMSVVVIASKTGSLGTWVLDYVYDLPFLQLLNSSSLDIVIMQGLSGGIGVILTVPIAAGFSAVLLSRHRQQQA